MKNQKKVERSDFTAIRERLKDKHGQRYWRSLDELAETPEFMEFLHREFPQQASEFTNPVSRRNFLKLMSASIALAGVTACTKQPLEKIVPYVQAPEQVIPGKPLHFATAFVHSGYAQPILAESHMGRPTKLEGNPEHPMSLGAADAFTQASVLTLYDPDRSQLVKKTGRISTWEAFSTELNEALAVQKQGKGLRILTETITSPTLAHQINTVLSRFPNAKWHQYEPSGSDAVRRGSKLAFGEYVTTHYDFTKADVVFSLDADFLVNYPESIRYTKAFVSRRRAENGIEKMNRLYLVESTPSLTGSMADHRLAIRASDIEIITRVVATKLNAIPGRASLPAHLAPHEKWFDALVRDLKKKRGKSVVIAGEYQSAAVQILVHAINDALGNIEKTIKYTAPVEARPENHRDSLRELVTDMKQGEVGLLLILAGNPVYNAPADLNINEAFAKVNLCIQLGLYENETTEACHWHIPEVHYLETWSDARAADGTVSIIQPLIAPLYDGKSAHEILNAFADQSDRSSYDIVHEYWQRQHPSGDFEKFWQQALHDGFIADSALPEKQVSFQADLDALKSKSELSESMEIIFRPDPTVWDGRFINNGWLQELPKPFTRLTWDNAVLISPATAEMLNLKNEDVVEINHRGRIVKAPVWIQPGQAENSITVHLGYGRTHTGQVGTGTGFNAYTLRTSDAPWFDTGVEIRKTGKQYKLASTQLHHSMENRHLVRVGTLEQFLEHPEFVHELGHDPDPAMTFYPEHKNDGYAWGMTVDLNSCTGCGACVTACQSENNIPIVGKEEVTKGREMHWIRVDRYYASDLDAPETYHQPVMCMHCENAPCEVVCPVAATTHSSEGLNEMVYNRCVGTRYCANNCPYKVRRFNFFKYADYETESLKLQKNPDVTVRHRGVMEKCTYCVQRINHARIDAKKEDREIYDGELETACQQTCPADAIVFGNINDPKSRVSKLKASQLNYGLLTDLNTKPRTSYLAKLRNPNPELVEN